MDFQLMHETETIDVIKEELGRSMLPKQGQNSQHSSRKVGGDMILEQESVPFSSSRNLLDAA